MVTLHFISKQYMAANDLGSAYQTYSHFYYLFAINHEDHLLRTKYCTQTLPVVTIHHELCYFVITTPSICSTLSGPSFLQNWLARWLLVPESQVRILLSTDIFLSLTKRSKSLGRYCSAINMLAVKFS